MSTQFDFEINALYALLIDRGEGTYTFHWRLYLHQSAQSGYIYHLINDGDSTGWRFDPQPNQNVMNSEGLLVALKIDVLSPGLHQPMLDRLAQIPIGYSTRFHENITCRVWLKEALFLLDEEGFINLTRSVKDFEFEASTLAMQKKSARSQA
ncbi:unnamed protein product [Penicillium salamii]|nr:unnamed protein product [Penicillium salamii]CAG8315735.1 unnamed protein product [Penicillium salamii]